MDHQVNRARAAHRDQQVIRGQPVSWDLQDRQDPGELLVNQGMQDSPGLLDR